MRRFLPLIVAIGLMISGCADISRAYDAATGVVIPTPVALVAANSFNALEATATNYIRLRRCTETNRPVCREPAVAAIIIPAVRSGRLARDNLVTFVREHPGKIGAKGLYDAVLSANTLLSSIYAEYQIGSR